MAHDGVADRRLVGELALAGIGLGGPHDRVLHDLAAGDVLDGDLGAHAHDVGLDVFFVDHDCRAQLVFEGEDALLEHGLLVLGVVVFGVLADVAEVAGLFDAIGDLFALLGGEVLDLVLQAPVPPGSEDDLSFRHDGFLSYDERAAATAGPDKRVL